GVCRGCAVAGEAVGGAVHGMVEVSRQQARRRRLSKDHIGTLRAVSADAARRSGVVEAAADPVLGAAPRAGPRAGMAGRAVLAGAVRAVIEGRRLERAAHPAGGRRRPLALVARQAARGGWAAGEMEAAAGPRAE